MPDGQGLQIYGAYKQRQQAMRNKLLDLMGKQIQMQTQEKFYRTRPGEVAREEYYKAGAEERRAGIGKETLPEIHYGLLTEEQKRKVAPVHFGIEPKAGEESLEEVYYGLLDPEQRVQAAEIKAGLRPEAKLPEKPTVAEQKWGLLTEEEKGDVARLAIEEEKFGTTPWFLSDEWRDTPTGKAALGKYLTGESIENKIRFWASIQEMNTDSWGKPINEQLFNRSSDEINKLLSQQGGLLKADTLKSKEEKKWFELR